MSYNWLDLHRQLKLCCQNVKSRHKIKPNDVSKEESIRKPYILKLMGAGRVQCPRVVNRWLWQKDVCTFIHHIHISHVFKISHKNNWITMFYYCFWYYQNIALKLLSPHFHNAVVNLPPAAKESKLVGLLLLLLFSQLREFWIYFFCCLLQDNSSYARLYLEVISRLNIRISSPFTPTSETKVLSSNLCAWQWLGIRVHDQWLYWKESSSNEDQMSK